MDRVSSWDQSEGLSLRQHALPNIAQAVRRHNVDGGAEQVLEVQLQSDEVQQSPARLELDQKVDVTVLSIVTEGYRAEDADIVPATRCGKRRIPAFAGAGPGKAAIPHSRYTGY